MTENKKDNSLIWIIAGGCVIAVVICIILAAALVAGFALFGTPRISSSGPVSPVAPFTAPPTRVPASPLPGSTPANPSPSPETAPPVPSDPDILEALKTDIPLRDRYDLASRFLGYSAEPMASPVEYAVGDLIPFYVENFSTDQVEVINAELVYIADNVYMWVEEGADYNARGLAESAEIFSSEIIPVNRSYFGMEPSPGIDSDTRLHILNMSQSGSVAGYFYSPNEFPERIVPYSNEKEMFFINIANTYPGTDYYLSVLTHEYQHMIHWQTDQNEESWLNEGLSELAAYLNGFGISGFSYDYLGDTDIQVNSWPSDGNTRPYYGAGFVFNLYFLDRFGQDAMRELIANPLNGMDGVDSTLQSINAGIDADQFFVDWTIANYINDPSFSGGIYGYTSSGNIPRTSSTMEIDSYPVSDARTYSVNQFGVDYISLNEQGTVTITFDGSDYVQLVPTEIRDTDNDPSTDDGFAWWSNRGDDSNMRLTREIDLTGVASAELDYDIWYQIEELWDYGYVSVSTDGGTRWIILETPYSTTEDPHGNIYGPAYSGMSADQPTANQHGWLHETLDLSPYTGQVILLRFEIITDDAANEPGMLIDNICIEAVGWCDDVEEGEQDWVSEGFVRHNNILPQKFSVVVLSPGKDGGFDVLQMALDDRNSGEITFSVGSTPATLVISGLTRHTTESASYHFSIESAD